MNMLKEVTDKRTYNMGLYSEAMKGYGANKTADAQASAAGGSSGGCFITTAVCDHLGLPDDNAFLNTFRKFRDEWMGGKANDEVKEYYRIAPSIAERIKHDKEKLQSILNDSLVPAYFAILKGDNEKAHEIYRSMVQGLMEA